TSWAPLVALPGSVRHRPDSGLTRFFVVAFQVHCCAPEPLHVHSWTRLLFAVPLWLTSRHLPRAWREPSPGTVHACAPVPLHVHTWTFVPSAVPLLLTSRQKLPAIDDFTGPVGPDTPVTGGCAPPLPGYD